MRLSSKPPMSYQTAPEGVPPGAIFSILLACLSPLLTYFFFIGGLISAGYGFRLGKAAGDSGSKVGIIGMVLNILAICFWVFSRFLGFRYRY